MRAVYYYFRVAVLPFLLFLNCKNGFSQIIVGDSFLDIYASAYVKSVDEFMQRFNAEDFHPDLDTTRNDSFRCRSILTLFDFQQFQVRDSLVAGQLIAFADTVCKKDIRCRGMLFFFV